MIEGLNLKSDIPFTSGAMRKSADSLVSSDEDEKLQFLLFVLDSLEARKLQVDSAFYSSILVLGAQAGGLQKRIASLLTRARKSGNNKEITLSEAGSLTTDESVAQHITSWEHLFENYSTYKEGLGPSTMFPSIRVSSKDFGRVLAAEQAVAYRGGRKSTKRR